MSSLEVTRCQHTAPAQAQARAHAWAATSLAIKTPFLRSKPGRRGSASWHNSLLQGALPGLPSELRWRLCAEAAAARRGAAARKVYTSVQVNANLFDYISNGLRGRGGPGEGKNGGSGGGGAKGRGGGGVGAQEGRIVERLLVGPCPRSKEQLRQLKEERGVSAILCLQSDAALASWGIKWGSIVHSAESLQLIAVQQDMPDLSTDLQARVLLDCVAAAEFLLNKDYTVYVCCASGDLLSPLLGLGYLTLVQGKRYEEAMPLLLASRPSSSPSKVAWQKAVELLADSSETEQQKLAHKEFRRRLLTGEPGSHTQDCEVAKWQLAVKAFSQRLAAERGLAQQLSKVTRWEASSTVEEDISALKTALSSANDRAVAAEQAAKGANERINFFFRQVTSLKEKEEASRQRARIMEKKAEALGRELADAERGKKRLSEELERVNAAATAAAAAASARTAAGVVEKKTGSAAAQKAEESVGRIVELQSELDEAAERLRMYHEKNEFLVRQVTVTRDAEQKARAAARASDKRYAKLLGQVEELGRREAAARTAASSALEKYRAMNVELVDLGCTKEGPEAVAEIREKVEELTRQVAELKKREQEAEAATAAAMEKLRTVTEKLERAEERERERAEGERAAEQRAQLLEERLGQLQAELQEAKEAARTAQQAVSEMSAEVKELKERESAADKAIRKYEALKEEMVADAAVRDEAYRLEMTTATQRIAALSELISSLGQRETEMCAALEEANEKIDMLSGRVEELVVREEEARTAAKEAEGRAEVLGVQVVELEEKGAQLSLEASIAKERMEAALESERIAQQAAEAANSRVQDLFAKVTQSEERESVAKAAAEEAYKRLGEMASLLEVSQKELTQRKAAQDSAGQRSKAAGETLARPGIPWTDAVVVDPNASQQELVPQSVGRGVAKSPPSSLNGKPGMTPSLQDKLPSSSEPAQYSPESERGAARVQESSSKAKAEEEAELEEKRRVLGSTLDECVSLFVSQVSALKEREIASKEALSAANKRIEALSSQVSVLAKREEAANSLAEEFASQVTELVTRIARLNEELEEAEGREAELAEALTTAGDSSVPSGVTTNGHLALAKKEPKVLIAELEDARTRADELAGQVEDARKMAEDISESIFSARKKSLQEQQQREELVAEVVALKEAMVLMKDRESAIATWKQQLVEQADYLGSLMDEGSISKSTRDLLAAAVLDIQAQV